MVGDRDVIRSASLAPWIRYGPDQGTVRSLVNRRVCAEDCQSTPIAREREVAGCRLEGDAGGQPLWCLEDDAPVLELNRNGLAVGRVLRAKHDRIGRDRPTLLPGPPLRDLRVERGKRCLGGKDGC